MVEQERRRHPRYYLRLGVRLQRGTQELSAEVVNASAGGCLLRVPEPLIQGEVLEVTIPSMSIPPARLLVLRSDLAGLHYLVATCFDQQLDDAPLRQWSSGQGGGPGSPLLH
jgi:hypothetical protein